MDNPIIFTEDLPDSEDVGVDPSLARRAWACIETVHAVTYFSPECRDASRAVGLRGFWMGYFASRAAPMGAVTAGTVDATFFNFHPAMVRRSLPDAWSFATPEAVLLARARSAEATILRLVPQAAEPASTLLPLLERAIDHGSPAGRALFAANRDVVPDGGPVASLWQCCTTLREHRGDGHVAVLTEAGLDGCEAHVLYAATEGVPPEVLRDNRGWSTDEWDTAVDRLASRGLLDDDREPTPTGRRLRHHIEQRTDELAVAPYESIGEERLDGVLRLLGGFARPIGASGEIPFPNPMGLRASSFDG